MRLYKPLTTVGLLACTGAMGLVGCGGTAAVMPTAQPARPTPVQSRADVQQARPSNIPADSPAAAAPNPCRLVTRPEAQTILGRPVAGMLEAPLGPTCIYRLQSTAPVTIAVQSLNFARVARQMTGRQPITVRGHKAYCGSLGNQMLYLALPGGRVLHVIAPCGTAARFAAAALSRLTA